MAKVSDLVIKPQSGNISTLFATWKFNEQTSSGGGGKPASRTVQAGSKVTINPGSTWYNGAGIPSFVYERQWIVLEVTGNRAVLNRDVSGTFAIMSAINVNYLSVVGSTKAPTQVVNANTIDHYTVKWQYSTGDGVWFDGSEGDTKNQNALYSIPSNAVRIKCSVTPVSKTYKVNDKDTSYWTGVETSVEYLVADNPPDKPSAPSVVIEDYSLTAKLENIADSKAEEIEFEVVNGNTKFITGTSPIVTARASYTCNITAGGMYRVRCRAINYVGAKKVYSDWSPYSSEIQAAPSIPVNVRCFIESKTSVRVTWSKQDTADSYTVEYTTNKLYFDSSNEVKSITVDSNTAYIKGLETGHEWFFRVKAINKKGQSGWSEIVYKLVGSEPEPPTTWTLTSTGVIGDEVVLYWVHNSEDGSKQTQAQIELTINGQTKIETVDTPHEDPDEEEKIYSYKLNLSGYQEGAHVLWRVRTKGIAFNYSEWSIQRTIDIFAPPVSVMKIGDGSGILEKFPFNITVDVNPQTQKAISYHISITSEYAYESTTLIGQKINVNAGDEIFSKNIVKSDNHFSYDLTPDEIIFKNNEHYKIKVTVAMDSGLITESVQSFIVNWSERIYTPDASIAIDKSTLCAYITPYCIDLNDQLISNVVLSVYRREFNGSFTEIAINVPNDGYSSVTDPHPSLDYARYRIIARNKQTNDIGFVDLPGLPVNEPAIVIQWGEDWTQFDYQEKSSPTTPPWTGSMIRIPYNIDITESYNRDASLVKYIGRKSPVGYYGTQEGIGGTWNFEFPQYDKETLYALRRLSVWPGNVYVREPSGNGYTAQIKVSLSIKHKSLTIPVTLSVTKVEGDK